MASRPRRARTKQAGDFSDITICGRSLPLMLRQWDEALGIEERIFENLVRVFYCNMEISTNRKDRVVTHVGGVRIEFDTFELDRILGISYEGLKSFTLINLDTMRVLGMSVDVVTYLMIYARCSFDLNCYIFKFVFFIVFSST